MFIEKLRFDKLEQINALVKVNINPILIQWGWGITGQSSPDWLKMTSSRTSKSKIGHLSAFLTTKIGRK